MVDNPEESEDYDTVLYLIVTPTQPKSSFTIVVSHANRLLNTIWIILGLAFLLGFVITMYCLYTRMKKKQEHLEFQNEA